MNVNLVYNYYTTNNIERQNELDYCFMRLLNNEYIDNIYVVVSNNDKKYLDKYDNDKITIIPHDNRPTFKYVIYDVIDTYTGNDDINILLNSDIFIGDDTDWDFIRNMENNEVFCLSRFELISITPFIIERNGKFPAPNSQDCWIFKGHPKKGMDIDFNFGVLGCDNRISWCFNNIEYNISGPISKIDIIHYHTSNIRTDI